MGKLSLKAKNPFGQDIELASPKNLLGLGLFAVMLAAIGATVAWASSQKGRVTSSIDGLHARMRGVGG